MSACTVLIGESLPLTEATTTGTYCVLLLCRFGFFLILSQHFFVHISLLVILRALFRYQSRQLLVDQLKRSEKKGIFSSFCHQSFSLANNNTEKKLRSSLTFSRTEKLDISSERYNETEFSTFALVLRYRTEKSGMRNVYYTMPTVRYTW